MQRGAIFVGVGRMPGGTQRTSSNSEHLGTSRWASRSAGLRPRASLGGLPPPPLVRLLLPPSDQHPPKGSPRCPGCLFSRPACFLAHHAAHEQLVVGTLRPSRSSLRLRPVVGFRMSAPRMPPCPRLICCPVVVVWGGGQAGKVVGGCVWMCTVVCVGGWMCCTLREGWGGLFIAWCTIWRINGAGLSSVTSHSLF